MDALTWRKSSYSDDYQGACVELAEAKSGVAVRDSKDPDGPVLVIPRATLRAALRSADE